MSELPIGFNVRDYIELNLDLTGMSEECAVEHFKNHGIYENRKYCRNKTKDITLDSTIMSENLLSVIIVNFNNEPFLLERLDSIFNQTYKPYEIIIIDDCSTDNSIYVIDSYIKNKNNFNIRFIKCLENSGSGYYKWLDGINMASGNLIHIAEADDVVDTNFYEKLLPYFNNENIFLSYSKSVFYKDNTITEFMGHYLSNKFETNFILPMNELMNTYQHLNIIPNVSSCIFRKPNLDVINYLLNTFSIKENPLVFDWLFYTTICKNWDIAFNTETTNYYRIHDESVSQREQLNPTFFIKQHFTALTHICNLYTGNINLKVNINNKLLEHLNYKFPFSKFNLSCFDKLEIKKEKIILIYIYSFSLGGGELFPINLANELYLKGRDIIVGVFDNTCCNKKIKSLLFSNIRVLSINDLLDLKDACDNYNIVGINSHHHSCDNVVLQYNSKYEKKIPHYIVNHGMYNSCEIIPYFNKYFNNLQDITYFIEISDKIKNENNNVYNLKNILHIPVSIKIADYECANLNLGYNEKFVMTICSRCIKEKGWKEMIEITLNLNIKFNNKFYLLLIGNGDYYEELYNLYKDFENIKFINYINNVSSYIKISDIVVLPSYYKCESTPLILIEALMLNKIVIANDIGDVKNMLLGKKGYAGSVIPLKNNTIDIFAFENEVIQIYKNKYCYDTKIDEIKHAVKKFAFDDVVNKYIDLFSKHI